MEGKSIKESDRLTLCKRLFLFILFSVFPITFGIYLVDDDNNLIEHFGIIFLVFFGVIAGLLCLPCKGDIQILDRKIGPCSRCNTLNSSLRIYRQVSKRERGSSTTPYWSEPRVHCMMCGCDMTAIEYRQENETAVTVDESKMSGSEKEESVESCVLYSSFEHGAKDKSKSLFSDLANAIEKEDREKKEKKPLVSHSEIV